MHGDMVFRVLLPAQYPHDAATRPDSTSSQRSIRDCTTYLSHLLVFVSRDLTCSEQVSRRAPGRRATDEGIKYTVCSDTADGSKASVKHSRERRVTRLGAWNSASCNSRIRCFAVILYVAR